MVEFKCLGHDSRHVCRSVLVAPGGFLFGKNQRYFSTWMFNWEKRADFSYLTSAGWTKGSVAAFCSPVHTSAYTFVMTTTTAF